MKRKLSWIVLLFLLFIFRNGLWQWLPFGEEELSLAAVTVAVIGGICVFFLAKAAVVVMELREVWQVLWVIIGGGILANFIGHWLAEFPLFGEFWGGFVGGTLEATVLWGALCGAKEVWQGSLK